jgi:phospholipid-transporting ATPase
MMMPLTFVVGVSMIKDIFEDIKRHKSDNEENNKKTHGVARGKTELQEVRFMDIKVGCIVKVMENEFFPCDMLLLNSAIPKGICYVETKNLDGETNLKHKQTDKRMIAAGRTERDIIRNFNGSLIECEQPNEFLYKFDGNLKMRDGVVIPLSADMFLLRGSSLRNTEWVYGVAVFTGHETKVMRNSASAKPKKSKIEIATDRFIIVTVLIQTLLSAVAGFLSALWILYYSEKEAPYLEFSYTLGLAAEATIGFGTWFLALMNFVAISLMVTLEMIKFFQAKFIESDVRIFCTEKGMKASVQTSNLNEELGMVHYIFSDKTGTLTQNIMEFKMFSAGPHNYGTKNPKKKRYPPGVTNVNFECKQFTKNYRQPNSRESDEIFNMLEALGVCHTVIAEKKQDKDGQYIAYNASSPDELALVNGARALGFAYRERDEEGDIVIDLLRPGQAMKILKYRMLNLIEFDSARKRMTVVVRDPDGKLVVFCKGADSIIEKRLRPGQVYLDTTKEFLKSYANEGLRTLLIARKELTEEFYK